MPHIMLLFPESLVIREFIGQNRAELCRAVTSQFCNSAYAERNYRSTDFTLIPVPIKVEDMLLAHNVLPLEVVVEGLRTDVLGLGKGTAKAVKERILASCPGALKLHFGVWLKGAQDGGFIEHKALKTATPYGVPRVLLITNDHRKTGLVYVKPAELTPVVAEQLITIVRPHMRNWLRGLLVENANVPYPLWNEVYSWAKTINRDFLQTPVDGKRYRLVHGVYRSSPYAQLWEIEGELNDSYGSKRRN